MKTIWLVGISAWAIEKIKAATKAPIAVPTAFTPSVAGPVNYIIHY